MSSTGSDLMLQIVFWVTIVFFLLGCILLILAGAYRFQSIYQQKRYDDLVQHWHTVFIAYLHKHAFPSDKSPSNKESINTPTVKPAHRRLFLEYWCINHAHVTGSGDDALNELASDTGMQKWITPFLRDRSYRTRVAAYTALGYMKRADKRQHRLILKATKDKDDLIAITALRTLIGLNPGYGLSVLSEQLPNRYWSDSRLTSILREAPYERVIDTLRQLTETGHKRTALVCFRLCEQLSGYTSPNISRTLLQRFDDQDTDVIMQFLLRVNVPELIPEIRSFLEHPRPEIRSVAFVALGRVADCKYEHDFLKGANDTDNWVRYQSVTSFFHLPGLTDNAVRRFKSELKSPESLSTFDDIYALLQPSGSTELRTPS